MKHLGGTRSAFKHDHLLQTPDTFVRAPLPGMSGGSAIVHCGPALGARFTQYTAELERDGTLGPASQQRFLYVLEGSAFIELGRTVVELMPGGFAYLPEAAPHAIRSSSAARLAIIEKPYVHISGVEAPVMVTGREPAQASQPVLGDDAIQVRGLLPPDIAFDFAMSTLTYEPGASLSMVEIHVMEHGLLMLAGEGIYRLGDCWYPVQAGDFIWMKAFCPQWFGALGKMPAKYLLYKDWNRSPLA